MSFNQYHPLPPDPPKEKYVLGLSLPELFWTLLGIVFSYKLMKTIPPLPIDNFVFSRIHFLIHEVERAQLDRAEVVDARDRLVELVGLEALAHLAVELRSPVDHVTCSSPAGSRT